VRIRFILLFIVIAMALSACGGSGESSATATQLATETPIIPPTLTVTPTIPLAILVLPVDLAIETSNLYQKTVYDLAQSAGYRFQVRNSLTPADVSEPGLKIVIALPPDPGVAALAASAQQVQFLAISIPGLTAGGNLSVLGDNTQSDITAFLAGYTAALITEDYRIGMMIPKDNPDALRSLNAYGNGMKFYCGVCRPFFYLPWTFPQYIEIPADEKEENYDAYADILILQFKARTIFLHPEITISDLTTYIGTTGIFMIGTSTPAERPAGWVMTIQPDVIKAIQNAWPDLASGQGGVTVQSPLGLSDVDPTLLSPGKQRLVQQTLDDLQNGLINTGVGP